MSNNSSKASFLDPKKILYWFLNRRRGSAGGFADVLCHLELNWTIAGKLQSLAVASIN